MAEKVNDAQPMRETLADTVRAVDEIIDESLNTVTEEKATEIAKTAIKNATGDYLTYNESTERIDSSPHTNNINPLVIEISDTEQTPVIGNATCLAVGANSAANSASSTAIGYGAQAGLFGLAIGASAACSTPNGLAIGVSASSTAQRAYAIGRNAKATGTSCIALGSNAEANGTNSIALGSGVETTGNNVLDIGTDSIPKRILHVAAPTDDTDAATKAYVDTATATVEETLAQSLSDNMTALSSLPAEDIFTDMQTGVTLTTSNVRRAGDIVSFDLNITTDGSNSVMQNSIIAKANSWISGRTYAQSWNNGVFELSEDGLKCNTAITTNKSIDVHFVTTYKEGE